jgi:chemotaxis methyl-accepting protein methylase
MDQTKETVKLSDEELKKILDFINTRRGIDLYSYRQSFVFRHLRGRLIETDCNSVLDYISYAKANPGEVDCLLNALSINVTHFFRDREVFDAFKNKVLPELIKHKRAGNQKLLRLWSAGCASGQEAYSLAILMTEALGANNDNFLVKIWATDVDNDALERAKKGEYEARDLKEAEKNLLEKYFQPVYNDRYAIKEEIKRLVRFDKHNLITDKGLKFIDVIFCRNVMIYFNRQQQEELLGKFSESLNSKGYLVIAKVETVWDKELFATIDSLQKIYQKEG